MDLARHFERLIAHDDWANRQLALSLRAGAGEEARRLFAHLIATEFLWLDRVAQRPQRCEVWPAWRLEEIAARLDELPAEWRELLRGEHAPALDRQVLYVNSHGKRFLSTVADIVAHTMLHGSYHRGQLARVQREAGATPANTDFIHAAREGCLDPADR